MSRLPFRVLVADDDPTVGLLMQAALTEPDFVVTVVEEGLAALTAFRAGTFDLVLLDVEMPGMDGFEVSAAIRATHGRSIPIMLITSHCDPDFLARAESMALGHIAKPVQWQALAGLLLNRLSAAV